MSFEGVSSKWHPAMAELCADAVSLHNERVLAEQAAVDEQYKTAQLEAEACLRAQ